MNSSPLRAFAHFKSNKIWNPPGSFAPATNSAHSRDNFMPPLMNFLGQTFRWMHPLIGVILICALWAIPAGGAVYSILEKPEIVPGSGAHPNTVLSTTSEYWQPNNVIVRPTRITWETTSQSRMECYVHGLSSIPSLKTTKPTPTDNSLESNRTDTYISTEINPGTDRIRSFTIYTDIDILFESAGATTITVTAEVDGVPPFNTDTTLPITVTGSGTASAVDFTPVSNFNIVVPAGASSGSETFTLTPEDDSVDETDETITVASTSSLVNGTDTISLRDDDAAPRGISLDATPNNAQENEGAEEFTVTATVDGLTTYATAQTIPIAVTGTLAAGAVDFTPVPNFSIKIPAESNSGSATFTLTPENDSVDETDETITIASSNSAVTNSITFLLRDDDATPRGINLLTNTNVIYEDLGAQDIALTLEISGPTTYATEQVVPLTVTGTGATGVVGFAPITNFSIVLPAEALTASSTLTITPTNNLVDEANETITLASSSPQITGPAIINLVDDDPTPSITLNATPAAISEADGSTQVTITAEWDGQVVFPTDQIIPLSITGSGTVSAVDFIPVDDIDLSIAAGTNSGTATFTLTPIDDSEDEVDETITVSSTNILVSTSATIILTDDEATPSISLAVNPSSIIESDGATLVTLTATTDGSTTFTESQTISINVTGSGTDNAVEFVPVPDFSVVFAPGVSSTTTTFTLNPIDNTEPNVNEIVTVSSTSPLVTASALISLIDDDEVPTITLSASPESILENDGATTVTVTATLNRQLPLDSDQILPIRVAGSGTLAAVDFLPVQDFDLTLAAGTHTGTAVFTLTPTDDSEDEINETITVGSTNELVTNSATIVLVDDDDTPSISLSAAPSSVREDDGPTEITVTATVDGTTTFGTPEILPINVKGSDVSTAVDFLPVADFNLTVGAGSSAGTATFILTPENDIEDEVDELVTIASTSPLTTDHATITLIDDDDASQVVLSVTPETIYEDRGTQPVSITGTLASNRAFSTDRIVTLSISGSADPNAVDFEPVADIDLVFQAGLLTATAMFDLIPVDDLEFESDATITVSSTDAIVSAPVFVTLVNDDAEPEGVVLEASPSIIRENVGPTKVTVTANVQGGTQYSTDQNIVLAITDDGDPATVGYTSIGEITLTVPAGTSSGNVEFDITPENNDVHQPDGIITISSSSPLVSGTTNITLENDDVPPTGIALSVQPTSISEAAGTTPVNVTATVQGGTQYSTDQNIVLAITDDGDPATVGYTSVGEITLTVPAGTSSGNVEFDITPENDDVHQPDGIVTISSSSPLVLGTANVTLENDDALPTGIALSAQPTSISEAAGATPVSVTATVQGGTTYLTEQTITVTASGSGQINAVDFDAVSDFAITIPARSKSAGTIIELVPENDQEDEQNETITFSSTNSLVTQEGSVTIVDDDQAPTGIAIALNPDVVAESAGPTEITVTLNVTGGTQYAEEKALTLRVTGSGLPGAVGFAPIAPIILSLPSGEDMLSTTFALEPVDNLFDEADEILTIAVTGDDVGTEAQLTLTDDDPEPTGFTLAVTPEIIIEGDGPTTINVTATVTGSSRYSTMQTLDISVADATAGSVGFESIPDFTIEVAPGADSGTNTFVLTPQENTVLETDATVTVTALHMGKTINATLLLQDDDQATARVADVNAALLPEATRAIIASSVGAVSVRIEAFRNNHSASTGNFSSTLSGLMMRFNDDAPYRRPVTESAWASRLSNNSLAASLNGRITVWGHADHRALSGNNPDYPLGYDGGVSSFHAGADMAFGAFLVGIAASQSNGDLDYEYRGSTTVNLRAPLKGLYQINTRMLSPYVNWSWSANSGVWTMASFGAGDVELSDPDMASEQAETSLLAFAAGIDLRLITAQSGFSLAVKGAAWTGQMDLDENASRISGLAVNVRRIQMSFEGAYRIGLASQGMFQPFVEAGVRGDGGDGQTGAGLEMGGGTRLALPSAGLRFTGQGRVLVAHKGNVDEWGFGGMLSYSPGGNTGPTLELGSSTGHMFGGTQKIWNDTAWLTGPNRGGIGTKFQSLLGYGFAVRAGTVTPYTGVELDRGVNTRMGAEYRFGNRLNIRLEASHRIASIMHDSSPVVRGLITLR